MRVLPVIAASLTLACTVSAPPTREIAPARTDDVAHVPLPAADSAAIVAELMASAAAWNRGDLEGHLAPYVESTTFMSRQGPQRGVDYIRQAFTRTYFRDGQPIQQLGFANVTPRALGPDHALVTGQFRLTGGGRDEQSGWFTLVWARTADGWRIIHDHSS